MSTLAPADVPARPDTLQVDIVIPVFNEAHVLAERVTRLHTFLRDQFPFTWRITIVNNASSDSTGAIATELADTLDGVHAVHLDEKGRGRALRSAWTASDADVVAYMDVDLSTDLDALLPLVAPLISGHSDVAIGSRLAPSSRVVRGSKREFLSRSYNLLLRTTLRTRFRDAQCGFKAGRREAVQDLLPLVQDNAWFFDTEFLVLAQRSGLRIHEVPVDWVDDPDSRVDLWHTAIEDIKGVWRVLRHPRRLIAAGEPRPELPSGMGTQIPRFALVGVACTLLYVALYQLWLTPFGPWRANVAALFVTMVINTGANRRFTFGQRGPERLLRQYTEGCVAFLVGLAASMGALAVARVVSTDPSRAADTVVLLTAGVIATVTRFLLFRNWVFRPDRRGVST